MEPRVRRPIAALASKLVGPAVFLIGCGAWALMPLDKSSPAWWSGASFFALSGLCFSLLARRPQSKRRADAAAAPARHADLAGPRSSDPDVLVPMLGALLAFRFRVINEWQLEKALAVQRKQRKHKQSLGRILLEMGLVTQSPSTRQGQRAPPVHASAAPGDGSGGRYEPRLRHRARHQRAEGVGPAIAAHDQ